MRPSRSAHLKSGFLINGGGLQFAVKVDVCCPETSVSGGFVGMSVIYCISSKCSSVVESSSMDFFILGFRLRTAVQSSFP